MLFSQPAAFGATVPVDTSINHFLGKWFNRKEKDAEPTDQDTSDIDDDLELRGRHHEGDYVDDSEIESDEQEMWGGLRRPAGKKDRSFWGGNNDDSDNDDDDDHGGHLMPCPPSF
uniref:Uncharacterized protein n=1 Tax=Strombidinopsis acuminata TaxID=141414 RepID=A0A7S3WLK2_9SPIT|mmetsp:Transcript_4491/g.5840  ORF Transcript_4491/g.5840 Transcript_4491/m.5840 type:complete len:115 (+) Transcript_4491:319-663(+)